MLRRSLIALALAAVSAAALAACGSGTDTKTSVETTTDADARLAERIQAELELYETGFDLESMPTAQADQLAPVVDNLPQAAGGVRILRVDHGVVEAETDFPDDEEGAVTGRLICGAIERSIDEKDDPGGHRVLGEDGAVLAECERDDANYP
jgi:hypothetical protein